MSSERPDRPRRPYAAPTVSPLSQPGVFVWQRSSRWMPIIATTNSGKMLFVCLCCGRQSPFPDKVCPGSLKGRDGVSFTCAEWERMPRQVVGPVKAEIRRLYPPEDCDGETTGVCSGCLNCTCDEDNDEV
jgi:hypothetical protein